MTAFPDINQFVSHCFQQKPLLVQQIVDVVDLFGKFLKQSIQPNQVTHFGWQPLPHCVSESWRLLPDSSSSCVTRWQKDSDTFLATRRRSA